MVLGLLLSSCDNDPYRDCYKKNYKALRSEMEVKFVPTHEGSKSFRIVDTNIHKYSEAEASILAKKRCGSK